MLEERLDRHPPIDLAGNQPQMDLSVEPPDVEELVKLVAMATSMLASRTGYSYLERRERGSGDEWEGQRGKVGGAVGRGISQTFPKSFLVEKTMQVPIL